uniref:N-acetylglucosaminylphosphatidylinositol deacetylase n=2 Tax=Toxoplasma gondii TaxID=5811 RepID=A0A2G8YDI1_TOXGO|nr:N-acetylglucosaminylphosphatidylinositol deacetylase [Toxoplasma gondii COUG]
MERIQRRLAQTSSPSHSRFLWGPLQLLSVHSDLDVFLLLLPILSLAVCLLSILLHAQASHARRFLLELLNRKGSDVGAVASSCVERNEEKPDEEAKKRGKETHSTQEQGDEAHGENKEENPTEKKRNNRLKVALVVAHPDDEVMFFTPTLALLRDFSEHVQVHLLCLSTGNAAGLGRVRSREFLNAARLFGVENGNALVLDDEALQDGWGLWSPERVADVVEEFIEKNEISTIFTFDERGVSRHPNHISVFRGVRLLHERQRARGNARPGGSERQRAEGKDERGGVTKRGRHSRERGEARMSQTDVYLLQSHGLFRKYMGVLDVILSTVACRKKPNRIASVKLTPFLSIRGMSSHWSQFVWFRWMFVFFSSYTYTNVFDRITV